MCYSNKETLFTNSQFSMYCVTWCSTTVPIRSRNIILKHCIRLGRPYWHPEASAIWRIWKFSWCICFSWPLLRNTNKQRTFSQYFILLLHNVSVEMFKRFKKTLTTIRVLKFCSQLLYLHKFWIWQSVQFQRIHLSIAPFPSIKCHQNLKLYLCLAPSRARYVMRHRHPLNS